MYVEKGTKIIKIHLSVQNTTSLMCLEDDSAAASVFSGRQLTESIILLNME